VCRPAADACDIAEACDGETASCPADDTGDADGDTVCDGVDNCRDDANQGQGDADADGKGDPCDPCTNVGGARNAVKHRIVLQKVPAPAGDDKIVLVGRVTIPTAPTVDPAANGLRLLLETAVPERLLDVVLAAGGYSTTSKVGWRASRTGTRWTYRNGFPSVANPVVSATVSTSTRTPGLFKFVVRGKNGTFPVDGSDVPLVGTVVFDVPTADTGQCAELLFPVPGACRFNRSGSSVTCR
jgi:hypothetical protein